jgi:hypothetical protein
VHVLTIHSELEGRRYLSLFKELVGSAKAAGVEFVKLEEYAETLLKNREGIPVCEVHEREIDGRSGTLAVQGAPAFCG